MTAELLCENYELTIGEDGSGVVLTFDLDDVQPIGLNHVKTLHVDAQGFHVELAANETDPHPVAVLFPMHPGTEDIVEEIRQSYGRLFVAALGPGNDPQSSAIVFAREMLLT